MLNVLILNDTRFEYHHGCSRVMNVIDLHLKKYNCNTEYVSLEERWDLSELIKRKIIQSDIVLINGEGTIHDNSKLGIILTKVARFAFYHNVKSYLINATFQNNTEISYEDLKYFTLISVRESRSLAELKKININAKVVPDLTFFYENNYSYIEKSNLNLYTDSVNKYKTELLHDFFHNKNFCFSDIFNGNLNRVSLEQRLKNIYKNNPNLLHMIVKVLVKIFKIGRKSKNISETLTVTTHIEYADLISSANYILCGRFHSVCYAVNSLTPFQAISSNTFKIEGLLEDIGLPLDKFLINIDNLDKINTNLEYSLSEEEKIIAFKKEAKIKINELFEVILNHEK
ncbi:polysaccharide pyruvyl transferase family protein [Acinetobacter sp. YH12103]|uniref:polysaccharide pyruvyl transferase family protein n=1 Tax=Acinetobacter sp. YH12103 TaxID=2601092 RepID=UPI0015D43BA5|nr:polysaccharide pyruvyl transferase family protein [Acinetobacter sp. YH12103]